MARPTKKPYILDLEPKKRPAQPRAKATVTAMLDAAAQILEREGYDGVTTNHVAEAAGVSIGSLYEYFPNKQSIIAAALARELGEIADEVKTSMRTALSLPDQPRGGIDHWMRGMMLSLEKRGKLLRVAMREVPFFWDIPQARDLSETLQHIAQEGRRKSERVLHFEDPEADTYLLMTMCWAAIQQTVLYRPTHISRERLTRTLVDMVTKLL
ncbi:MAG: TetR/AcrR family transcriptional regulator [Pseudomonadota bacterium]